MGVHRHSVSTEIRRVVARLGGYPDAHGVGFPTVAVSRIEPDTEDHTHGVPVALQTSATEFQRPGANVVAIEAPRLEAHASPAHRPPTTEAHYAEPPPAIVGAHVADLISSPGLHDLSDAPIKAPDSATVHFDVDRIPLSSSARPFQTHALREEPLPRRASARLFRTLPHVFNVMYRERIPATTIPRQRLADAWNTLLREHPLPPDQITFVGFYGPVPLGAVTGARVTEGASLAVEVRRRPMVGPVGDIIVGFHKETRTVVRSAYPRRRGRPGAVR